MDTRQIWSLLPYEKWSDTLDTLHMKMQIAGKVKLALNSFLNQWWHVAFYLNMRGMTSGIIPYHDRAFEVEFDFNNHVVSVITSDGEVKVIPLLPASVATFYSDFLKTLNSLGISININTMPCEFPDPVCFDLDQDKKSYDKDAVHAWWKILVQAQRIFEKFRSGFRGKSSPIHFFWGSFDLCGTRFSGNSCDIPSGAGSIMKYAENEENFTFGFWPGDKNYPHAAFYSYLYPAPEGIENAISGRNYYDKNMREFILDYSEVIESGDQEGSVLRFLNETYNRAAKVAGWDIESLTAEIPGIVQKV